jgi:hypothetical protein
MSFENDPEKQHYGPRRGDGMGEWMDKSMEGREDQRRESPSRPENEPGDDRLPTISLVRKPHPTIANLFQHCFEYVEPWSWSVEAERVETGKWFVARPEETETAPGEDRS